MIIQNLNGHSFIIYQSNAAIIQKYIGSNIGSCILATNNLLMKYKIRDDNICSFFKREPEKKLEHLFCYCEIVQDFWNKIEFLINMKSDYILSCISMQLFSELLSMQHYICQLTIFLF